MKVEDLRVVSAAQVARQNLRARRLGDWEFTNSTMVYCHDVVGGEAGYTEVQNDAGGVFYKRHFDSERIHELYLHFPPTMSIPLSGRKLKKYVKWATPGERGRVFKLPGENGDLPKLLAKTQLV